MLSIWLFCPKYHVSLDFKLGTPPPPFQPLMIILSIWFFRAKILGIIRYIVR